MRTKVSFVIPTLNRGRYVVRAVESCLSNTAIEVDVEVVVLDSMSDDGSWEILRERFGDDTRVILAQNERGLGPTHSWLDGARLVTGDYVTFLWSDDYISPDFIETLLPPLLAGCHSAICDGVVRDIDDESPLAVGNGASVTLEGIDFLRRHLGLIGGPPLPVSPAVALFTRPVFNRWIVQVEDWCRRPGINYEIMWRRAIGPDLMLFLEAANSSNHLVSVQRRIVAQFSSHSGSISISSSPWPLRAGYWLAKSWAVSSAIVIDPKVSIDLQARLLVLGLWLTIKMRSATKSGLDTDTLNSFRREVRDVRYQLFAIVGPVRGTSVVVQSAARLALRTIFRGVGFLAFRQQ